jgi:hypothetical protein
LPLSALGGREGFKKVEQARRPALEKITINAFGKKSSDNAEIFFVIRYLPLRIGLNYCLTI